MKLKTGKRYAVHTYVTLEEVILIAEIANQMSITVSEFMRGLVQSELRSKIWQKRFARTVERGQKDIDIAATIAGVSAFHSQKEQRKKP